jgi:Fe-S cluster assembly iron-binding protein IscA
MLIQISDGAKRYLDKKIAFYHSMRRVPRIIIAERSCSGAVFRLLFDAPHPEDTEVEVGGLRFFTPHTLLDEFGGFALDVEQFFFATRLKVSPIKQSFRCNCDAKCSQAAAKPIDDKGL